MALARLGTLLVLCLLLSFSWSSTTNYKGYQVLRVQLFSFGDYKIVQNWAIDFSEDIDIWKSHKDHMDVMISPRFVNVFKKSLRRHRLSFTVTITNVQSLIDKTNGIEQLRKRVKRSSNHFDVYDFHDYIEMMNWMWGLERRHPRLAQTYNLSQSYEGNQIVLVKLGRPSESGLAKPSIWIDGGMHAREWLSPATCIFIAHSLLHNYERNREQTWLLDTFDVYILPLMNPDGYVYTRRPDGNRFWRKTRSNQGRKRLRPSVVCRGVDLNRNFDHHWGEESLSRFPCDETFAGPESFSEPEADTMRQFVESLIPNLKIYLSFHSYGQLFLSPWGYTLDNPEDVINHVNMAKHATRAIQKATNATYEHGTIAGFMYRASGTSIDYFYSLGVRFSYAVELRPRECDVRGFIVRPSEIAASGKEMLAALLSMARALLNPDAEGQVRPPPPDAT